MNSNINNHNNKFVNSNDYGKYSHECDQDNNDVIMNIYKVLL